MYYYSLAPALDPDGRTDVQTDLRGDQKGFLNIQSSYWSGTPYPAPENTALGFDMTNGQMWTMNTAGMSWTWAVRRGDVTTVPEPATALLLSIGIASLLLSRKRPFERGRVYHSFR